MGVDYSIDKRRSHEAAALFHSVRACGPHVSSEHHCDSDQKPDAEMGSPVKITVSGANFFYGSNQALHDVSMEIRPQFVTALIGPSGCGKSTFLRSLNRMNDLIPGARLEGKVELDGENVYSDSMDVIHLRRRVGMILDRKSVV